MSYDHGDVIIRFDEVTFKYGHKKDVLKETDFSVRENAKITVMGQNGAGKSTIFKLITGELKPTEGQIHIRKGATIGIARQLMPKDALDLTVREYFQTAFKEKKHDIDRHIAEVLDAVNLATDLTKTVRRHSGGQQARLLLAHALIQKPDILLLDEPTNNLDKAGIDHLTGFLVMYEGTVIVISHDAEFLNAFTHGVLYLDSYTHHVEQFVGDYLTVIEEISARIEREQRENAQLKKDILDSKEKINFFSHKGGKMRRLASKMRDAVEEAEENMVDVRKEDRAIRAFNIGTQEFSKPIGEIKKVGFMRNGELKKKSVGITLRKRTRILIEGPNGVGKSTLLHTLATSNSKDAFITEGVKVGYYHQDFAGLDFDATVMNTLAKVMDPINQQQIFATAAHFLIPGNMIENTVGSLSEGQKGLLCYARFMLQKPGLLILDEPTNHINFRHLPVIAEAIENFEGCIILVSHMPEFIEQIRIDERIDLGEM